MTAHTPVCPVAAMENAEKKLYAVQFHPEVMHTQEGVKMLSNFVYKVCGCSGDWKMDSFVENTVPAIREKVGDGKVLCAFPAVWIPPWRRLFFPRPSEGSSPVCLSIMAFSGRTRATRWRRFSARMASTI